MSTCMAVQSSIRGRFNGTFEGMESGSCPLHANRFDDFCAIWFAFPRRFKFPVIVYLFTPRIPLLPDTLG